MPEPLSPSGNLVIPVAHGSSEAILREPPSPSPRPSFVIPTTWRGHDEQQRRLPGGQGPGRRRRRGVALQLPRRGRVDGTERRRARARKRTPWRPWRSCERDTRGCRSGWRVSRSGRAWASRLAPGAARSPKLLGIGLALSMFDYRFLNACEKPKRSSRRRTTNTAGARRSKPRSRRWENPSGSGSWMARPTCPQAPRRARNRGPQRVSPSGNPPPPPRSPAPFVLAPHHSAPDQRSRGTPPPALSSRGGTVAVCRTCRGRTAAAAVAADLQRNPRRRLADGQRCCVGFDEASCQTSTS